VRDNCARAEEHAGEIDADDVAPLRVRHLSGQRKVLPLHQLCIADDACVVHQHVNAAEIRRRRVGRRADGCGVRNVDFDEVSLPSAFGDLCQQMVGTIGSDIPARDAGPFVGKPQ
jgi:hypothetical protein